MSSPLTLEQKIGQLFFIGIAGPSLDSETAGLLSATSPGGVCLFARNIKEPAQTRQLTDDIRNALPRVPLLSIDQEGGLVDRLRRIMAPSPAASRIASPDHAAEQAEVIARSLRLLGLNMDFAPVVDVMDERRAVHSNGLATRTYGASADEVTKLAGAFLDSLQAAGIIGCLKHFPGLGASQIDSHEELPQIAISNEEFEACDLKPYRDLLANGNVHAVMVAHATFSDNPLQETDGAGRPIPSSLSRNFVTGLLLEELGFEGLVITDDLEMGAIMKNYGIGEACVMALEAGVDMLAICADAANIYVGFEAILDAVRVGRISVDRVEQSLARIEGVRARLAQPLDLDIDDLESLSKRTHSLAASL